MKIHIFGASGAGSTTQGNDLSKVLNIPYFDSDDYFWEVSDPPYMVKRERAKRLELLHEDLAKQESWIIGGSLVNWGEEWLTAFDFAVFLYVPPEVRLERLKKREYERYGDIIYTVPERIQMSQEFIDWSAGYDSGATGRSLIIHEMWMKELSCPVLAIREDLSVEERRALILKLVGK
ncbi:hypothetical protein K7432_013215 [Basidiobolus ranarum]|uniref:Adenylate kinase n=1 Tax=Basidiobolus ranarum TaxID=34480 RepID=A0ABR2WJI9_9FUNG